MVGRVKLYISALQLENGELLLVVSPQFNANAIQDYALRWEIETLFSCLKGKHPANTALPSGPISLNLVPT
ncbi:putative transposase [Acinetobacter baumannii 1294222]|nr:putative transposase [Acinetobacter baumannii 1294222]